MTVSSEVSSETTTVERLAAGLWLLRFPTIATVTTDHSQHLLPPLIDASARAPIVLLAQLPPDLRLVPAGMAPFWLNAFLLKGVRVKAIGLTSTSRAVRVVLAGIEAAMKIRAQPIPAQPFDSFEEMVDWGYQELRA